MALAVVVLAGGGVAAGLTLPGGTRQPRLATSALAAAPKLPPPVSTPPAPSSSSSSPSSSRVTTTSAAPTTASSTTAARPTSTARRAPTTTSDPQPPRGSALGAPGIAIASPGNPLPNYDLPGPFITQVGSTYYLYLSTALGVLSRNITVVAGTPGNWDWAGARDALPVSPAWALPNNGTYAGGQVWEPEVFKFGSEYVMYMSPIVANYSPTTHCIGVAESSSPIGPFTPRRDPIVCQLSLGGDIDAQVFVDPSGPNGPSNPYYLTWKSDNNNLPMGNPNRSPTDIWVQGLSNDGLSLTGSPVRIFAADEAWQQGLVEAPQLFAGPGGTIYVFYSGGACFCTPNYGMGVARCASVMGPCQDLSPSPLLGTNAQGEGPGEETVFQGPDKSVWLLYSPWYTGDLGRGLFRPVEAARIGFGATGPYVAVPGTFPDP